ncbi:MAG: magnesium/cobalt transporter CorA [Chloroflexia bacterium]|nr:magnesium/cobalt transporter CorA [Chloroflexia bacterium]
MVDSAIYVDGRRVEPSSLEETYEACRAKEGIAWIGLYKPTQEEFSSVAGEFALHPLAVEDAVKAHQRPKLEQYGDTRFVVLKAARYLDEPEIVEFGELHVFVGRDFVVTVRHGESPDLAQVRQRMEDEPELLRRGPEAILYAILDQVVDDYAPVVVGLENDIDEIEETVFGGGVDVSRRTYELSREVIQFQRATTPLVGMLDMLTTGHAHREGDAELLRYLRDVHDHAIRVEEQVSAFRELLHHVLNVNLVIVGLRQNDEVKTISAWAAILFAPSMVGTIYGMNFDHMPELHWLLGYPFALLLMVVICVALYIVFKRRHWLT